MAYAGIDVGGKTIKVVILGDGKILAQTLVLTGREKERIIQEAFDAALKKARLSRSDIERIVATGLGRKRVSFANDDITMVNADARGIVWFFPSVRTVIDVGAEEGRAIRCDEKGKVKDFALNEKCAAGAGMFAEAMARALEIPLEEMGKLALKSKEKIEMNAQCAVFGESEVVSLIHRKIPKVDIIHAVLDAIAGRIGSLAATVEVQKDLALIGGMAKNVGFVDALKRNLGMEILIPQEPEFVGALGAALIAASGVPTEEVKGKVVSAQ